MKRETLPEKQQMHFEGNEMVIRNILLKKKLMDAGDPVHEKIRPLLYIGNGGMKGVYGAGEVTALEKAGLTDVFDIVIGNSTGAPTAAYFLAGQAALGTTIYHEECATSEFINKSRALRLKKFMNARYLAGVFRNDKRKKLLQDKVRSNRSEFYIVATDTETGKSVHLDAKKLPDMIDGIQASIAVPGISNGEIEIEGVHYGDGGTDPLPIQDIIERYKPTDILVLANRSEYEPLKDYLIEEFILPLFMKKESDAYKRSFRKSKRAALMQKEVALARNEKRVRIATIWTPKSSVGALEQNSKKLQRASRIAEEHLTGLLQP